MSLDHKTTLKDLIANYKKDDFKPREKTIDENYRKLKSSKSQKKLDVDYESSFAQYKADLLKKEPITSLKSYKKIADITSDSKFSRFKD